MGPRAWRRLWKKPPRFTSGAACSKSGSEYEGMTRKTAYRSSTVRNLTDESFGIVVVEDCGRNGRTASQGARN
jgi:hypothetical protein